MSRTESAIEIRSLTVSYRGGVNVVDNVNLTVREGEVVAIVGPSGSGKTTILEALLGTLPATAEVSGEILVNDQDMATMTEAQRRAVRGEVLGYVSQDPFGAVDNLMTVGTNIAQSWKMKQRKVTPGLIVSKLDQVSLSPGDTRRREYPFSWSGGMLQRASIVAAGALDPAVVLADEPTSALDSNNAHGVMGTLTGTGRALLVVSHDVDLVCGYADRVYRMAAGRIVSVDDSATALREYRDRTALRPPRPVAATAGTMPLLQARSLTKNYGAGRGLAPIDFDVRSGQILGISGSSGTGKSTLLRLLAGEEEPTSGKLLWDDPDRRSRPGTVAMVFQNPRGSLNPRWPLHRIVTEPLRPRLRDRLSKNESIDQTRHALERVGLGHIDPSRGATQLSGGQAQRVAIARALVGDTRLLLADEPTAALDDESAEVVMTLMRSLTEDGLAIVVVSHDDRILENYADTVISTDPAPSGSAAPDFQTSVVV